MESRRGRLQAAGGAMKMCTAYLSQAQKHTNVHPQQRIHSHSSSFTPQLNSWRWQGPSTLAAAASARGPAQLHAVRISKCIKCQRGTQQPRRTGAHFVSDLDMFCLSVWAWPNCALAPPPRVPSYARTGIQGKRLDTAWGPTAEPERISLRIMSPVPSTIKGNSVCSSLAIVPLPPPGGPQRINPSAAAAGDGNERDKKILGEHGCGTQWGVATDLLAF